MSTPEERRLKKASIFAASLLEDLAPLGYRVSGCSPDLKLERSIPPDLDPRLFYRSAHQQLQRVRLRPDFAHIAAFERKFGRSVFITGDELDLKAIAPVLRVADLKGDSNVADRDRAIVNYVRRYQTVNSRMSVGRENAYILEDYGQRNCPVMGVLVLASPMYFQPRRDEVLGWATRRQMNEMSQRAQTRHKAIRDSGLKRIMHVAVCCALPPYSILRAARLLAIAPFCELVLSDYTARWKGNPDLAFVTTTSGMGQTATPFQRLIVSRFFDTALSCPVGAPWNREGKIYCRLGANHPWQPQVPLTSPETYAKFDSLVSPRTVMLARRLAAASGVHECSAGKALDVALKQIGFGTDLFRGNSIGVFIGAIDRPSIRAVATGKSRAHRPRLSWDLAVRNFRSDFGEEVGLDITRAPELVARQAAIVRRRERASATTLLDIKLSNRIKARDPDTA